MVRYLYQAAIGIGFAVMAFGFGILAYLENV